MNELQKLLRLRNISVLQLSEEIGIGYHTVQKTVKAIRQDRPTQEAIAAWFGLPVTDLFGPSSGRKLTRMIEQAINGRAAQAAERMRGIYLRPGKRIAEKQAANNV